MFVTLVICEEDTVDNTTQADNRLQYCRHTVPCSSPLLHRFDCGCSHVHHCVLTLSN